MSEIIYGIHAILTLLEHNPQHLLDVYLLKGKNKKSLQPLIQQLEQAGIMIQIASRKWFDEKAAGAIHQGIIARVQAKQLQDNDLTALLAKLAVLATPLLLLVLDGVTDPHNLGACLRCADATGVHAVIVPRNRAAPLNATAKKVASGAAETVPLFRITNLTRTLRILQEAHKVWIVGTDAEATNTIYQSKLTRPLALVMGAENVGIRRLTREHCNELIRIPMAGAVSSLNVSVAAGVCLFEAVRQRMPYVSSSNV